MSMLYMYIFEAKVYYWGQQQAKKSHKSKYLMSILLHNNHHYRSRVQKEIDFSSVTTHEQFYDVEKGCLFVVCPKFERVYFDSLNVKDGLLVVLELQSKTLTFYFFLGCKFYERLGCGSFAISGQFMIV